MAIFRVSDAQSFTLLTARAGRLQVDIRRLQEEIASGRRLTNPADDPRGAAQVVRLEGDLAALGQYTEASRFGTDALGAQDEALGDAEDVLLRAREIATQQATGLLGPAERVAAREEVHGLLQALTVIANGEFAGRRLFGNLALDAPAPFADPDTPGWTAATAFQPPYSTTAFDFEVQIGGDASDRVRLGTRGDTVFGAALAAVEALETALAPGGDVAATLDGLVAARDGILAERASVGARQAQLLDRVTQAAAIDTRDRGALGRVRDADLVTVIARLTQAQTALQATLAAGAEIAQTSLVNLIRL